MQEKSMIDRQNHVLVALSGGVDSSIAAVLLKEAGYAVEGAIMVFEGVRKENIDLAARVAQQLDIPFHRVDLEEEFNELIVGSFSAEYGRGRTPNPCVLCNTIMKFDLLPKKAGVKTGKVATGHYARIERDRGRYILRQGKDKNEQSYFLYRLNQEQLAKTILPLGYHTKDQVRRIAKKRGLETAMRKKSQDACFIPDGDYTAFLKKIVPQKTGPVIDNEGRVVGQHKGIIHYTIGQRHGLGISHKHPYYVSCIDAASNTIQVSPRKDVYRRSLIASDLNYIPFDTLEHSLEVTAKVRYFSPASAARVQPLDENTAKVTFKTPQWAITPGQSVVFYQGDLVIGGGIIDMVVD